MNKEIRDLLLSHLMAIKEKISLRMVQEKRNASGETLASIIIKEKTDTVSLVGDETLLYLERGRGPGKIPVDFVSVISDWIIKKGISYQQIAGKGKTPEQRLRTLSGAIAHNIKKKGTLLYRKKGFNDIYTSAVQEELNIITDEISTLYSIKVNEAIGNEVTTIGK